MEENGALFQDGGELISSCLVLLSLALYLKSEAVFNASRP